MFIEAQVTGEGNRFQKNLGIYGVDGVGKTTLCKSMCSYSQGEFGGRVVYVELPNDQANERIGGNGTSKVEGCCSTIGKV